MSYILRGGPADGRIFNYPRPLLDGTLLDINVACDDRDGYDIHTYQDAQTTDDEGRRVYEHVGVTGSGDFVISGL